MKKINAKSAPNTKSKYVSKAERAKLQQAEAQNSENEFITSE